MGFDILALLIRPQILHMTVSYVQKEVMMTVSIDTTHCHNFATRDLMMDSAWL